MIESIISDNHVFLNMNDKLEKVKSTPYFLIYGSLQSIEANITNNSMITFNNKLKIYIFILLLKSIFIFL